jgi:hypothetical protein
MDEKMTQVASNNNLSIIFDHDGHELSIDPSGRLHWDGRPVLTEQKLQVSKLLNCRG